MTETVLRKLRLEKGIKLTDMANQLGIRESRLSMMESGQRPVPEELTEPIAAILGVEASALFLPTSFTVRETEVKEAGVAAESVQSP